jgi:hypothetical protein
MTENEEKIGITLRSFIPPQEPLEGYELGRPFKMELPRGMSVGGLAQKILGKNINQLGISAVNGQLAKENLILSGEDKIDFFALIEGG